MKLIIALVLFIPVLWKCFRSKKWYLSLFFAFYGILPDTFAIELSASLPLLTGKRILILLLIAFWVARRKGNFAINGIRFGVAFFAVEVILALVNLRYGPSEINSLFIIIFERALPLLAIRECISDEDEFKDCIDVLLFSSVSVAFVGILQILLNLDVSTVFNLVTERAATGLTDRMGMMRAKGLTNAIQYGSYCAFMIILSAYVYLNRKKVVYLLCTAVNLLGLILSMSRSSMIPVAICLVFILIRGRKELLRPIVIVLPAAVLAGAAVLIARPGAWSLVVNLVNSTLNTLGGNFKVSSDFGMNANGAASRLMQFTLFPYMFENGGWLLGRGYTAFVSKRLVYFYPMYGKWSVATTLDVGFVGEFAAYGIIGLIAKILFVMGVFVKSWKYRNRESFDFYCCMCCEAALYLMLNFFTSCMSMNVFWMLIMLYYSYKTLKGNYYD